MISKETRQKWKDKVKECIENVHKLNDWENEFIDSIEIRLSKQEDLTHKQSKVLNRIFPNLNSSSRHSPIPNRRSRSSLNR